MSAKKYSFSRDEEHYQGEYDSVAEAMAEAEGGESLWVGVNVSPPPPEHFFDLDDWIEKVCVQDEYSGHWAEGYLSNATKPQREELEVAVQKVIGEWLDRHDLRPKFWNVADPVQYTVNSGIVVVTATGKPI
jgi:hypothetical protein